MLRSRFWVFTLVWIISAVLFSVDVYARAGGGGGSGGKGSWLSVFLYPFVIVYVVYVGYRINRKNRQVKVALKSMAEREPQWAEENLLAIARDKFILLQTAWGNQDLQLLKKELHPVLYPNWESQIKDQMARGEKNVMNGLSIESMKIVDVKNFTDDEKDEFTVCFDARANDQTISHGVVTKTDNSSFREFWTFEWEKGQWALREVTQRSGWRRFVSAAIIDQSKLGKK